MRSRPPLTPGSSRPGVLIRSVRAECVEAFARLAVRAELVKAHRIRPFGLSLSKPRISPFGLSLSKPSRELPFGLSLSKPLLACDVRCGPEGSALPGLRGAALCEASGALRCSLHEGGWDDS